jgi:microcystin-dependent protein
MSQPFLGEIRLFAGTFAPVEWHFCDGSLLPIDQYAALFNLIGTTYGGDGQNTFGLPDLCSRIPVHQGTLSGVNYILGQRAGEENVTLAPNQMPIHSHPQNADANTATSSTPVNNVPAAGPKWYTNTLPPNQPLHPNALALTGGNQSHPNLGPYVAVNYIICLNGIYPSQN